MNSRSAAFGGPQYFSSMAPAAPRAPQMAAATHTEYFVPLRPAHEGQPRATRSYPHELGLERVAHRRSRPTYPQNAHAYAYADNEFSMHAPSARDRLRADPSFASAQKTPPPQPKPPLHADAAGAAAPDFHMLILSPQQQQQVQQQQLHLHLQQHQAHCGYAPHSPAGTRHFSSSHFGAPAAVAGASPSPRKSPADSSVAIGSDMHRMSMSSLRSCASVDPALIQSYAAVVKNASTAPPPAALFDSPGASTSGIKSGLQALFTSFRWKRLCKRRYVALHGSGRLVLYKSADRRVCKGTLVLEPTTHLWYPEAIVNVRAAPLSRSACENNNNHYGSCDRSWDASAGTVASAAMFGNMGELSSSGATVVVAPDASAAAHFSAHPHPRENSQDGWLGHASVRARRPRLVDHGARPLLRISNPGRDHMWLEFDAPETLERWVYELMSVLHGLARTSKGYTLSQYFCDTGMESETSCDILPKDYLF